MIKISAVICSYNRPLYLQKAVRSLKSQTLPKDLYEIIVVDNGNTKIEGVRYLKEPVLGLSAARNKGIKSAKGKYIAFLDDDAEAFPDWLENIVKTFEKKEKIGCAGGKIEPVWESRKPRWLDKGLEKFLSLLDYSDKEMILKEKTVFGANMAFPKKILEEMYFDESLGRKGDNLLSGEEVLLQKRIREKGYLVLYNPEIKVKHHIGILKMTKKWFKKRASSEGLTNCIIDLKEGINYPERLWKAFKKSLSLLEIVALLIPGNNPSVHYYKFVARMKLSHIANLIKHSF